MNGYSAASAVVAPSDESASLSGRVLRSSQPRRQLFEVLPLSLFRPLTGQGAPFHALVLGNIFEMIQSGGELPDEKDILNVIGNCLEAIQPLSDETLNEYAGEETESEGRESGSEEMDGRLESDAGMDAAEGPLLAEDGSRDAGRLWALRRTLARRVLRYLIRHGWLHPRPTPEGGLQISLPPYAAQLLLVFLEITRTSPSSRHGTMFAITDLLREAARQHDRLVADNASAPDQWAPVQERVAEAARQMRRHVSHIHEIQHNLDKDLQQAFEWGEKNFPDVWNGFLGRRREHFQSSYHQVRTEDYTVWFLPEVRRSIDTLQSGYLSDPDTEDHLNYILTRLEQMDVLLRFIDQQRGDYVRTVQVGLSRYLRGEQTDAMRLDSILRKLALLDIREGFPPGIIRVCQLELRTFEWLGEVTPEVTPAPPAAPVTAAERAREKTRLLTRLLKAQRYSLAAVEEKVLEWLQGRRGCHLSELPPDRNWSALPAGSSRWRRRIARLCWTGPPWTWGAGCWTSSGSLPKPKSPYVRKPTAAGV